MANSSEDPKQPFVSPEDRPETGIDLDRPVSDLRVRDLVSILGGSFTSGHASSVSKIKWRKEAKNEKPEFYKEIVKEKWEVLKEVKNEKWEYAEPIPIPIEFENPNPPDPRLDQLIQTVSGLARQVAQLGNQLEALQRKVSG